MTDATYRSPDRPRGLVPYTSSGRAPILGVLAGLGAGALAALVLAVIYAYGTIYIPIVQVKFMLTALFGVAIGASTTGVMHAFKVRSRAVIVSAALALGVFGWAFSWLPWLHAVFAQAEVDLALDPWTLARAVSAIYENGTWSVGRWSTTPVSGVMLGIVWAAEAATIVGLSTFIGVSISADRVFCEECDSWCTVLSDCAVYDLGAADQLRAALLHEADLAVLESAPLPTAADRWLSLTLGFCPRCGATNVVAIDDVKQSVDRNGNVTRTPKRLIAYHCVSRGDMQALRRRFEQT